MFQTLLTVLAFIVGAAMVAGVTWAYVKEQRFHAIGGSVLALFGAAIVAFCGGASVLFKGPGENGGEARISWDAAREGEGRARDTIIAVLTADVKALREDMTKISNQLGGGNLPSDPIETGATDAVDKQIASIAEEIAPAAAATAPQPVDMANLSGCRSAGADSGGEALAARYVSLQTVLASNEPGDIGEAATALRAEIDRDPANQECWATLRTHLQLDPQFDGRVAEIAKLNSFKPLLHQQ